MASGIGEHWVTLLEKHRARGRLVGGSLDAPLITGTTLPTVEQQRPHLRAGAN